MIDTIYELDKEGISLQETRLNLKEQGYGWIWDLWIRLIYQKAIADITFEIAKKQIDKL